MGKKPHSTHIKDLAGLRERIDAIDARLLKLLNERAQLVKGVGEWKRERGLPAFDSKREAQILDKIAVRNPGPLPGSRLRRMFEVIIQESRLFEADEMKKERAAGLGASPLGEATVSILGLGLIGGSFALAMRQYLGRLPHIGYDPNSSGSDRRRDFVQRLVSSPMEALKADLVFLAMPVEGIIRFLEKHGRDFRPGTLVVDLGSTKREICQSAWRTLPQGVTFIGGHPLAGKAVSGPEHAEAGLFQEKPFVFCPKDRRKPTLELLEKVSSMVEAMGARPVVMTPEAHDRMLAASSHLPQLMAIALAAAVLRLFGKRGASQILHGPAFLEMTRLCSSDFGIWRDIVGTNRDFILRALDAYIRSLQELRASIRPNRDYERLRILFVNANDFRKKLLSRG